MASTSAMPLRCLGEAAAHFTSTYEQAKSYQDVAAARFAIIATGSPVATSKAVPPCWALVSSARKASARALVANGHFLLTPLTVHRTA